VLRPIYVVDKDPRTNTVTVGTGEDLMAMSCAVGEANWLVDASRYEQWTPAWAQHRYNSAPVRAEVRVTGEIDADAPSPSGRRGAFEVRFEAAQRAVAPGQALVVYDAADPDVVAGGGWITSASKA